MICSASLILSTCMICTQIQSHSFIILFCWCCLLSWFGTRLSLGLSWCGTRVLLSLRISLGRIQTWTLFILWLSRDRTGLRLGHLWTGINCLCLLKHLRGLLNLEHSMLVYLWQQRTQLLSGIREGYIREVSSFFLNPQIHGSFVWEPLPKPSSPDPTSLHAQQSLQSQFLTTITVTVIDVHRSVYSTLCAIIAFCFKSVQKQLKTKTILLM